MVALDFPNGPTTGDKYPVTPVAGQPQYTWDGEKWTTVGAQVTNATPSSAVPLMDATPGLAGTAAAYSRGDHVHPTDTTRAALSYVDTAMVGYAAQTTTATQKAQARANLALTKRNYILNGAMMVSQENGSTAGTVNGFYPVDNFTISSTAIGGTFSIAQVASLTPSGSPHRIRVTVTAADAAVASGDIFYFDTRLEGLRVADLAFGTAAAKTVILQFGVKAPAGTYSIVLYNAPQNRSYVAEYVIAAGETNTDVVKSVVVPGDTTGTWAKDNTSGLQIRFGLMAGTTYQQAAGSWGTGNVVGSPNQFNFMGVNGNIFELFDVGLYEGSVAPSFMVPDYASELVACMRYFQTFSSGNLPVAGTTDCAVMTFPMLGPMRTMPTVTHPYTDANFTSSGSPAAGTWGLQRPQVAAITKTGTMSFTGYGNTAVVGLVMFGMTLSSTAQMVAANGLANIKLSTRL